MSPKEAILLLTACKRVLRSACYDVVVVMLPKSQSYQDFKCCHI